MLKLSQAIVVEGKYDVNTIRQITDAPVFSTSGFGIMNNSGMLRFLRKVAIKRGLIILTDSDGAGFVIRGYLKGALPKENVFHAYIPDIYGKEKRKSVPGKEGKIGVEGMPPDIIISAIRNSGALDVNQTHFDIDQSPITRLDLYQLGFSGREESKSRRCNLLHALDLPDQLNANAILDVLNMMFTREEFIQLVQDKKL